MSHSPISEDDLHAFVDGALDGARHDAVAAYIAQHPDIARRVDAYARHRDLMRAAFAPVADEPVPSQLNLHHLIENRRYDGKSVTDHRQDGFQGGNAGGRIAWFGGWQGAAAAIALLCVGGGAGWGLHGFVQNPDVPVLTALSAPEGIGALAREASASYVAYARDRNRPVEIRADKTDDLLRWISDRVGMNLHVPDLTADGYRFMGGRVVATDHGPAAMLMYDDDQGVRLVMLARPMQADQNAPMQEHHADGVTGFSWASMGTGYSVVGPLSDDLLHPVADQMRKQLTTPA
jgi:anti-sigma factor RsiW